MGPQAVAPPSGGVRCVALVGLPGSGKSTVGRQLAKRLGVGFADSDHVIEERIGTSIREFFDTEGEQRFRDVEESALDDLTQRHVGVLSTGGGSVLRVSNRERLHARCVVFYLKTTPEEVFRRLRHDQNRPLLQVDDPQAKLRALLAVRDPLYRASAHFVVETGRPSVALLVNTVLMQLELAGLLPLVSQ